MHPLNGGIHVVAGTARVDPPAYLNPQLVDEPLLHIGVKVRQAGTEGNLSGPISFQLQQGLQDRRCVLPVMIFCSASMMTWAWFPADYQRHGYPRQWYLPHGGQNHGVPPGIGACNNPIFTVAPSPYAIFLPNSLVASRNSTTRIASATGRAKRYPPPSGSHPR